MKDRKILINIATNLKSLKIEEYLERFKQNFEEVKQGQQKIVTSIEASRKENRGNFDQLSQKQDIYHDDDKREHKKTQEGIERVEEGIESHSKKINEIHKSVLTQENKQVKWPIWFDVKKTVTLFAGREGELNDLHKKMQDSPEKATGISRIVSISGLGGMGKTQLARRYVYDHKNDYDGNVIWIDAKSYQTLAESFSRLAGDRLEIRTTNEYVNPKDITSIVQEVYELFAERKSLFIFDNVENIEVLRQFLPPTSSDNNKPYVLITSRIARGEWEKWGIEEGITLDEFTEKEAISFVRKALKIDKGDNSQDNEISKLAIDVLYRFPLALEQAVGHIKEESRKSKRRGKGGYTIVKYLEDYKERENELLNSKAFRRLDNDYEKTTLTTWIITTDKIKDDNEHGKLALKILDIIAYLAPKNIPVESFFLKLEENEEKLWGAAELLSRYSMIELDSGKADIHQLVQKVMRINSVDEKREEETLRKALKLIKGDNVEKKASSQGSCIFYPCTVAGRLSNIEMHATYIWSYASKYSQLIKDFYSAYGENRNTPINLFATTGEIEAINSMLKNVEKGELMDKVNDYNQAGYAPIHSAAFNGHKDIVEYFIEKQGVGVNFVTNVHKNTPTFAAVLGNQLHVVEYLVGKKGADPDKGGKYDTYPIHYAALYARKDFIEYLVEKRNADILVRSNEGRTVLHFALLHLKRCREHTSDTEWIVKCLLNKNSDLVKHKDCMGMTALHLAVEFNAGTIITMLLNYGADVNAKSHIAKPRIMDINVTRKEIRQPVDTDGHDKGYTPLHIAADKNLLEAAKLLLKKGAIYNRVNMKGETPLQVAKNESEVGKLLNIIDKSFQAVKNGEEDEVRSLLQAEGQDELRAILNARNTDNDKSSSHKRIKSETLLHIAAQKDCLEIVKLLLKHGAIYSAINDERNTPLDIAELRSDVEKLLTSIGESFEATKGGKKDKLDSLLKGKDYDVLEAILNARNRDEKTLLQVASANKQRDIAELLIQKLEIQSRYLSNISIQSHVTQDKATLTF